MLYYNNRYRDIELLAAENAFNDEVVHKRRKKTEEDKQKRWLTSVYDIFGCCFQKKMLIKDYYKGLF